MIKQTIRYTTGVYIVAALCFFSFVHLFGIEEVSDRLSLLQTIITLALIPTAIVGFYSAIDQFRSAQAAPDLEIIVEARTMFQHVESDYIGANYFIQPSLVNKGNAVAVWYMLNITIPRSILNETGRKVFKPIVGDENNWKLYHDENSVGYTFMSNDQIAAYPRWPLLLAEIRADIFVGRSYPSDCTVAYTVTADRGITSRGEVVIAIPTRPDDSDVVIQTFEKKPSI